MCRLSSSHVSLPDLAATVKLAERLVPLLRQGDMLALRGSLGAGKTTFARALLQALGIKDDVPSPTFTLLQSYETKKFSVTHLDLYRLKNSEELDELGWDDVLADGLALVEWPERAGNRLPNDYLTLHFTLDTNGQRACQIEPFGTWKERIA